ncbi:MAG: FkbM family methyltransferase [Polyangiaceae bacterium]|nr:FkbM family methyltransferase [Polyangiaceae bacterium]MCW5791034.1 FkbM family methyltransferase [Polyangiaceae bacterium]
MTASLSSFARNVHSQTGEDGVIEEALRRLAEHVPLDRWCVEFGAWDGLHLSNTLNLIRNQQYSAVLIEADPKKYRELCANLPGDHLIKLQTYVELDGPRRLDGILAETPIPRDFDFVSIDIDGCDYYILESLVDYRPKLICIEFNPTIPNEVEYVQERSFEVKRGASAASLVKLAEQKGYTLAAVTPLNVFFVRSDLASHLLGEERPRLDALRDDSAVKNYVFSGYDGSILFSQGSVTNPWNGLRFSEGALQKLPRLLRRFPSDYSPVQRALFAGYVLRYEPGRVLRYLRRRTGR